MNLDVLYTVLEVAIAFSEVHLEQVTQQVLYVCREVGGIAYLCVCVVCGVCVYVEKKYTGCLYI